MALVMIRKEDARPKDGLRPDGKPYRGFDYFRSSSSDDRTPEGFLVEVYNYTLGAHFHDVDEFQILFGQSGSFFQRTPVKDVMIHYADAYVTYGPLIGSDPPLAYFTLRAAPSSGIFFMPESRDRLAYRGQRHFEITPEPYPPRQPHSEGSIESKVVIEDHRDGLEARVVTAGPDAAIVVKPTIASSGQFVAVINGSITYQETQYNETSLGWQYPEDEPAELCAGATGCRMVILRLPYPSTTVTRLKS